MADAEPTLGGFVVCRPAPLPYHEGSAQGFRLMSDLHVGAAHVDYRLIQEEIADAVKNRDRLLVNGDVLDLILPKDAKRYDPDALHPRVSGRRDVINAAIEWAVELLAPAAHLLDMVGLGNHETAAEHWHSFDPLRLIVWELQKAAAKKDDSHVVHYGGYTGFVDYRFHLTKTSGAPIEAAEKSSSRRYVVYYHHGGGGAAPVTKGLIDFHRRSTFVVADVLWHGHKHSRLAVHVEQLSCPLGGRSPKVRDVRHIQTGAYFRTYQGQSQRSIRKHGRRSNYAADAGMAPQGKGGCRLVLGFAKHGEVRVRVEQ